MKDFKSELEKVEFDIIRIKFAIEQYVKTCEILGIEPDQDRIDTLLDTLNEYLRLREELRK